MSKRRQAFEFRRASQKDGAALCDLLRRVHMKAELDIVQERDPDFFALLTLHDGEHDVWLGQRDSGALIGCGSISVRPGWFEGQSQPVGYLGDLRIAAGARAALEFAGCFQEALAHAKAAHGCELFYTVIFDDNVIARRALVRRRGARRRVQPHYRVMTPFQMTSVQFTLSKAAPSRRITRATERDFGALLEFLQTQGKDRVMGDPMSEERLKRRFSLWPNFSLSDFRIARDSTGRIVGTVAPWNSEPVKRTRVLGYSGSMAWVKRAFNIAARVGRFAPLPPPGELFRFAFLSHLEIENDDPSVLRDLLLSVYRDLRQDGLHFMSAMIPRESPLEDAFRGFMLNRTAMTVYAVTASQDPRPEDAFRTLRPGFEMALS